MGKTTTTSSSDSVSDILVTDGQKNKYLRIKKFFEKLIELKNRGCFFLIDDEIWKEPYIDGIEMGFKEDNFRLVFVGCTHTFNKVTGEYDIPWIDVTMKELKQRIVPLVKMTVF